MFSASPYTRIFWDEYIIKPQSCEYNLVLDQDIEGDLDLNRLCLAVEGISRDYILFNHVLDEKDGQLFWVKADNPITLEYFDSPCDAQSLVRTPFDLRQGPLCRFHLIKTGERRYNFLVVVHHVLLDGLSGDEFYALLSEYYNKGPLGLAPAEAFSDLLDLYARYEDDVAQLRGRFDSTGFWRDLLSGCPRRAELPCISSGQRQETAGEVRFDVSFADWRDLKAGIKYANHFLIFKTLWAILIARQTGQEKVCIAYPVAAEGGEKVYYGGQVNTAVFPLALLADSNFSSLYKTTLDYTKKLKVSGRLRHSKLPVHYMLSESPVAELNVSFSQGFLKNFPLTFDGCRAQVNHRFNDDLAGTELLLEYQQSKDAFEFRLRYDANLFDAVQMAELAEQYQHLLWSSLSEPDRPLSTMPYLSEEQAQRLENQSNNDSEVPLEHVTTLFAGFEENARLYPTRMALVDSRQAFSYGELAQRSSGLARRLREEYLRICGEEMPADTLIPLYVQRGANAVVAMLAIMKAGAAYVPLDPYAPAQRLAYILSDVGSPIVLTETALENSLKESTADSYCLLIDRPGDRVSGKEPILLPEVSGEQLAYVIYTSGTTGKPKGTLCEHRGAANMILGHGRRLLSREQGVLNCLQFATLAFDAHVFEVFIALNNGHRLCIASEPQRLDLELLTAQMREWQINFCLLPPALLGPRPLLPDSLRCLAVGGESTSQDVLEHYLAAGLQVANLYGPTEASVSVSINLYRNNGARNIGLGIANMRCYVVDEHFHPLPLGVEGELCLAGVGLARGYLNLPELTASAFIENPFSQDPDYRRLYRTGDRVRRLADGSLEYCGRADQQVKINGYRIELGEIESVMRAVPGVAEALVTARKEPAPQLQAWFVVASGSDLTVEGLWRQLSTQLPAHMVPTAMMAIPRIPLTVSRKVDYRALPEPAMIDQSVPFRAPGNELESQLLALFNRLLGSHAGIDHHFFRLGGNSILAIRLCHEIYKALGIKVSALTLNRYPTVALLSEHLAQQERTLSEPSIARSGRSEARLSFQQSRLWFMENLSGGATHYLSPVLLQLSADADCATYIKSLQAVVARHQVLRSLIRQDETGEAYLHVTEQELAVPIHSVTQVQFTACLQQALQQPIDLLRDLPLRAAIYRYRNEVGAEVTVSLLVFHHIAFDGWSMDVLLRELAALYQYFPGQTEQAPPALDVQYLDYAVWQREQSDDRASAEALAFWDQALDGYQQLDIAPDYLRPTFFDARGSHCEVLLAASLVAALESLARKEGVTLHAVLLAGFTLLLARYTNQDDIVVGTPLANRSQPELESLIGFFVNSLPLRNRVPDELSVCEFIRQVAANTAQVQQHQSFPLEQLVDRLGVPRDFSRHPLFQVMFALESTVGAACPDWLSVVDLSAYEQTAKFDLTLTLTPVAGRINARFNFATVLFSQDTISRLAGYYVTVLQQLVEGAEQPLRSLGLASAAHMQTQLAMAEERRFEYSFERTLQHDFIRYAQQHPQAVAVIDELGEMTYGELYLAALTLSTQLRLQGGMTGEAIAILADKGRLQPVAILAALMCGKAFLPMDKGWPLQRRLGVMAQASINTLLSSEPWETSQINVVGLSATGQALTLPPPARLLPAVDAAADSLAYIIFTSGSTGTPKGVAIEHRSVVNMLEGTRRYFAIDAYDRSLALSALSFDLAIFDIFSPLSVGGAVVMPAENDRVNPQAWYQSIINHRVTVWLSAPALLELLLDYVGNAGLLSGPVPALRAVMVGGDWIATSLPERCRQWAPHSRFCSAGGATEAAVFSILYEVPPEPVRSVSIPYGKPLPHERFYVLDAEMRPLPVGVKGEMYIAGEGLARGYYADAQRTADSFFWHEHLQERVYRTGDAGRFLSDGNLEFMGRIDQQVKVNGYRIELGEIENITLSYPDITMCCVVLIQHPQPYLAAYLVATKAVDIQALSQYLRGELPQYMLPKAFIQLDSMPLTENGKIARKSLPLPESEQRPLVAAESDLERECCLIWGGLLKLERVSVEDNFFSLGGNSILAIQACYQISRRLRREVTLGELGQYPTIRALCRYLRLNGNESGPLLIPALQRDTWPLSFSQMQLWFIEKLNGGSNLYHVPMLFRLSAEVDLSAYRQSLKSIVARHHVLRSVICQPSALTALSKLTDNELRVQQLRLDAAGWQQQLLGDIDRPFALDSEIPLRASLYEVRQPDGSTILYSLIVVHHLAFDGWSQNLFLEELQNLYESYRRGQQPTLPDPLLQYGDYACWQREYLDSARLSELKTFWQHQLQGWQTLEMPLDFVRPAQFDHRGANHGIVLPEALMARAEQFIRREGVTPFALFLSAFNLLLSCFSGQQDVLVGTPVANRPTTETRSVVGFFVNTLPLRTQINDEMPLSEYVREVFKSVLQVQKYQSLPLEQLIDALQVPRDLSRHPLFQVLFVLEDDGQTPKLPDWLEPQSLMEQYQAAKFDLTLNIQKEGERVQAVFNYATALFTAPTMSCLSQYYLRILEQIVGEGHLRINQLELVPAVEVRRQREAWKSCPPAYDFERAIHHDFIQHARQQPRAIAIIDGLGELTYGELYQAALTLSLQLRQHVDMDAETIAVMVDKGRAQIIAVLAIVMSGKAYLPLDSSWPEGRRRDVLRQSQTRVVFSSKPWKEEPEARLLLIDPYGAVAMLPAASMGEPMLPDASELAYVIFTSGSTGVPKGVAIEHRGAVNSIVDTIQQLNLNALDRGLALSALSFDISAFDIFGLLSVGGTMVMPSEAERYQPDAWHRLMVTHGVTFWNSAPSVMTLLVEYLESVQADENGWPMLRTAVLVGEVIAKPLPARIRQWNRGCRVVSAGGATESSIWSILYDIPDAPILAPSVPYGKAMAHQRFYVLDSHMRLLPPCLPGEQYIGGAGVARGYFRNEPITRERFIYHPELDERLYRTGDAGRYLPDGNLEFMGRMDFQVKINGYRVELGEVESQALAFDPIKSCCAIVCKDEVQERLALYYVCDEPLVESELLESMSQRLPLYMIPTVLIRLPALPFNSSGKLDRKALPAPGQREQNHYVAPANGLEQQLCELWQATLKREQVGMTDDFFRSGGTSLMAISVCMKMSELLKTSIPVVRLFQCRTLRNLLAVTESGLVIPLNPAESGAPVLWMIHPALVGAEVFYPLAQEFQGRMNCQGIDNHNLYHQPTISSLGALADRYLDEMIVNGLQVDTGRVHILGWSLGGLIALEIAAKLEQRGATAVSLYLLDSFYQQGTAEIPLAALLPVLGLTGAAAERARRVAEVEEQLSQGQLSVKLQATTVTLFKAMQANPQLPGSVMKSLVAVTDNGLGAACSQLSVVPLACHHHNILESSDEIIRVITGSII
ncbi:non-ribosomal peptide synthetase [Pseudomonas chlororaphis]|uniref:non-ribosomal peptide synthetase n=1 Tax=Pseudomonas chlororaphis TaxID=587753 RepID=UPI002368E1C4|nr:non-ribosomal peptide synthetase [Pseudomonas chlororaphis]WDG51053.1 amino acid adenylation domain-containing protein [Pseudomonas chlororaphis]